MNPKPIFIIDCFVHSESIREKLLSRMSSLKSRGHEILLITNTKIKDPEIIEKLDYLIYVEKNNLFSKEYTGYSAIDYWASHDYFTVHTIELGKQRHGLSVLINMWASVNFINSLGYTHFHRLEVDAQISEAGFDFISSVNDRMKNNEVDGVLYANRNQDNQYIGNFSFQYMSCDVKTFLENFPPMRNEEDYEKFLINRNGNLNFVIAEDFLYNVLRGKTSDKIIIKDGISDMSLDFPDTQWNTSTTPSMDNNLGGFISGIYDKLDSSGNFMGLCVYSKNTSGESTGARIKVINEDDSFFYIEHSLGWQSCWSYNDIPSASKAIEIYSLDGRLVSTKTVSKENSSGYLQFH
jgi:hypothetical protein